MPIHQIATKFNVIWISSFHLNTIKFFTLKINKSHPINDDHTQDTNIIYFFHFIDIYLYWVKLKPKFYAQIGTPTTHNLFPMGKANEPSKVENSTTRVTRLVLLMLDDVNKSFLKIKELTIVYRYCTPCPKVVKPQIQTLGLNKMVETYFDILRC